MEISLEPFHLNCRMASAWSGIDDYCCIAAVLAAYGNLSFDGVVDAHFYKDVSITESLIFSVIDLLFVALVMSLIAPIVAKNFRLIDILGTMALSRTPYLLLAFLSPFISAPPLSEITQNPMFMIEYPDFLLFMLISLFIVVWYIVLMCNGLKVSVGIKGARLHITFIVAIIIAEVLSKVLIGAII